MGASCASGKSAKRMKNNSTPGTNTSHMSSKQCNKDAFFEQAIKENIGFKDSLESDHKVTKTQSKYLANNESKSTKSNLSSMTSTTVITKQNLKPKSQKNFTRQPSKSAQPQSEQNSSTSNKKITQLEHFILERKRYMQERGVVVYTPYTVLPPPILKSVGSSSIQKKRNVSCPNETSLKTIQENRKKSSPASMLSGDIDTVIVEI